jgi:pyridinium-3,5-biscarboxylic acid mononucleotide synthase
LLTSASRAWTWTGAGGPVFPEVIFGSGKTPAEVAQIAQVILEREPILLATRITRAQFDAVQAQFPAAVFHERARCLTIEREPVAKLKFPIGVVAAGTSDLPVAEEAAVTL